MSTSSSEEHAVLPGPLPFGPHLLAASAPLPDDALRLVIRETQNNAPLLIASFAGQRRPLTSRAVNPPAANEVVRH